MTAAIETIGLSKSYGPVHAVTDLNLRVDTGEIFAFLGPNGAGKTTTVRMLLALQRPTAGRATLLGLDSQQDSVGLHGRTGYVPGDLALYPHMTGRQHIDWFARARGQRDSSFARELVDRFAVVLDRPVRDLSKGNRQKIGLVLAFMHRPDLLILDEPTAGFDPLVQDEFERLVRETVREGRTVFLSSHQLDEVQRLADRVGVIRSGSLIATETVDDLRRNTPLRIRVRFRGPVDPAPFAALKGVSITANDDSHIALQVTGSVGPVLRLISEEDPVDLVSRHADLDELFREFYRDPASERGR